METKVKNQTLVLNSESQYLDVVCSEEDIKRIWGINKFRLFISHSSKDKEFATIIKNKLLEVGIGCFVAHDDIEPGSLWSDELEKALNTMDACLCLLSNNYHNACWPDHEVGYAYGRGKQIIPVDLGLTPYGIMQKIQAIKISGGLNALHSSDSLNYLANETINTLMRNKFNEEKLKEAYVWAIENSDCYDTSNKLALYFKYFDSFDEEQVIRILRAFVENTQVRESFDFIDKIRSNLIRWNSSVFPDYNSIEKKRQQLEKDYKKRLIQDSDVLF